MAFPEVKLPPHKHFFKFMHREHPYLVFACKECQEECKVGWNVYRWALGAGPRS